MFEQGRCAFGQTGAAQSHLANNGVGIGDLFLFFGLFSESDGSARHHLTNPTITTKATCSDLP